MSRVLLADDSPHAQRMGEKILRDEGFEVASVTDGATALIRLLDVDPDLILVDAFLPNKSGYDICREIRRSPRLKFTAVVLTYGLTETISQEEVAKVGADGVIQKPFDAVALLTFIRPLIEISNKRRSELTSAPFKPVLQNEPKLELVPKPAPDNPFQILQAAPAPPSDPMLSAVRVTAEAESAPDTVTTITKFDEERVRAAVTVALDAAMPQLVDEITRKVLLALKEY